MARSFDGAADYYSLAANLTSGAQTFAGWFFADSSAANNTILATGNSGGSATNFRVLRAGSTGNLETVINDGVGTSTASSTVGYSTGVWNHGAAVFASSTSRTVYLNGGNSATETTSGTPSGLNRTAVGAKLGNTASGFFDGHLADVAAWNIALSAADIASLALGFSPLLIRPDALIFYMPMWGYGSPEPDLRGGQVYTVNGAPAVGTTNPRVFYPSRGGARFIEPPAAGGSFVAATYGRVVSHFLRSVA